MLELVIIVILLIGRGYTTRRLNKINKTLEETCAHNDERIERLSICTEILIDDVQALSTRIERIDTKINTPPPISPED